MPRLKGKARKLAREAAADSQETRPSASTAAPAPPSSLALNPALAPSLAPAPSPTSAPAWVPAPSSASVGDDDDAEPSNTSELSAKDEELLILHFRIQYLASLQTTPDMRFFMHEYGIYHASTVYDRARAAGIESGETLDITVGVFHLVCGQIHWKRSIMSFRHWSQH